MLPNARSTLIWPPRVTRNTRLWCPSVTSNPPRSACRAYWTPLGTKKSVAGGWLMENAPMSATTLKRSGPSTR